MTSCVLTNKAVEDLSKIWDYTYETWSENQANRYYNLLLDSFHKLSQTPNLGKRYENITNGLLGYITGRHIFFYREMEASKIEIVRILHGRMDLKYRIRE